MLNEFELKLDEFIIDEILSLEGEQVHNLRQRAANQQHQVWPKDQIIFEYYPFPMKMPNSYSCAENMSGQQNSRPIPLHTACSRDSSVCTVKIQTKIDENKIFKIK